MALFDTYVKWIFEAWLTNPMGYRIPYTNVTIFNKGMEDCNHHRKELTPYSFILKMLLALSDD